MVSPREEFDNLNAEKKLELIMPRVQIMIGMLKDTKLNYEKFLVPKGAMNKDSITYTQFMEKYYYLFPKDRPDENRTDTPENN